MKEYTKEEVVKQIEKSCEILYKCCEKGDYETGNKEQPKLIEIFKYFEKDTKFAMECINELLINKNVVVSTKIAAWCLALNENVDKAVKVLLENSKKEDAGIFGFEAEMILKIWKQQGYLCMYEK